MGDLRLAIHTQTQGSDGNSQLGRRNVPVLLLIRTENLHNAPGPFVSLAGQLLHTAGADADDGKFGRNEKPIQQDEGKNYQQDHQERRRARHLRLGLQRGEEKGDAGSGGTQKQQLTHQR